MCLRTLRLTASLMGDEIYRDLNLLSNNKAQVEQGHIVYDYMRQGARTI